jgi:hypothetical protein
MNRKRTTKYKQGIFAPRHKEKYKGSLPIFYRSSLELRLQRWLDSNPAVISWGSETVIIPYNNPLTGRVSRYFTDFNFTMRTKDGIIKKFLVEVKPHSQTLPPTPKKKSKTLAYQQAEYVKNKAKWMAAKQWAANKGYEFVILTEKHLIPPKN